MQADNIINKSNLLNQQKIDMNQYLTFTMKKERYGIDIISIMEIRKWEEPKPIPAAPHYVTGVINLRGTIVPIIDLRLLLNFEDVEYTPLTVIIVVEMRTDDKVECVGLVIDAVTDVLMLSNSDMQYPPSSNDKDISQHVIGMFNLDGSVLTILNVESIVHYSRLPAQQLAMNEVDGDEASEHTKDSDSE